jgi:hypothetical protein
MTTHPLEIFLRSAQALGWKAAWKQDSPLPVLLLRRLVRAAPLDARLEPDLGQPSYRTHGSSALGFEGHGVGPEQATHLDALAAALERDVAPTLAWTKLVDPSRLDGYPSLQTLADGSTMLELRTRCIERCHFCDRAIDLDPARPKLDRQLAFLRFLLARGGVPPRSALALGGSEPLAHEGLLAIVAEVRAAGHTIDALHTAGWPIDAVTLDRLVEAGLRGVKVPLYGRAPEVHDRAVRLRGAHARALEALALYRDRGLEVVLTTLALREGLDELGERIRFLQSLGPARVVVEWPRQLARAPWLAHDYVPDASSVRRSLEGLEVDPLPRVELNLPPCAVPEAHRGWLRIDPWATLSGLEGLDDLDAAPAPRPREPGFEAPCDGCAVRGACPGLACDYASLHDVATLVPLTRWP